MPSKCRWVKERGTKKTTPEGAGCGTQILPSERICCERVDLLRSLELSFDYVCSLRAFLTFGYFELHRVALLQTFVSLRVNCTVVHKDVGSIGAPDETIPLCIVEPLDGSFQSFHEAP
jgi:hypothetical protein